MNNTLLENDKLPEDEKEEILRRREICKTCPFFSVNAVNDPSLNYKTERKDEHCTMCGCPYDIRTASLRANCGIEYHNNQNPNNQLPLKWEAYQPKPNK